MTDLHQPSDGLLNPFAEDRNSLLVHADKADRSSKPFTCPWCRASLHLRAGEERRRHFSHGRGRDCVAAAETFLHRYAKELIDRTLRLRVPEHVVAYAGVTRVVSPSAVVTFDRAAIELREEGFRPDLVLYREKDGETRRLMVEIHVTHAVGAGKRERIAQVDVSTIEIRLSRADVLDGERLDEAILNSAPRHWIYHRHDAAELAKLRAEVRARPRPAPVLPPEPVPSHRRDWKFDRDRPAAVLPEPPIAAANLVVQHDPNRDPYHATYFVSGWERRTRRLFELARHVLGDRADEWLDERYPGTETTRYMRAGTDETAFRSLMAQLRLIARIDD